MKKYIIFAGVNGAGKSTLYQTLSGLENMKRVNSDEIVKEFGSWKNSVDVAKAGKIAVSRIRQYLEMGETFNQETTLCGNSIIRNIIKSKELGYIVEMHYVGVDSPDIAKERIKERVLNGGHGIPDSDVDRRYVQSFSNLKDVIPLTDVAILYDNTENFRRFAIYRRGKLYLLSKNKPKWYENIII
ncbi:MAG: AAA family ATPase [Eubacterium sp.]|nr:AAA family ATPase [Eubacterium sp.]